MRQANLVAGVQMQMNPAVIAAVPPPIVHTMGREVTQGAFRYSAVGSLMQWICVDGAEANRKRRCSGLLMAAVEVVIYGGTSSWSHHRA